MKPSKRVCRYKVMFSKTDSRDWCIAKQQLLSGTTCVQCPDYEPEDDKEVRGA